MGRGLLISEDTFTRLVRAMQWVEQQMQGTSNTGTEETIVPPFIWRAFVLKTDLAVGGTAEAYIQRWDPSADGGDGSYPVTTDVITVRDAQEQGYYGSAGASGKAYALPTDNSGTVWAIFDLECP